MKQKLEPKSVGTMKEDDFVPWNGVTLNRCLAVAAIAALLSVGFQVLQESVDSDDIAEAESDIWTAPELNDQQQSETWFFEGWFGSSTPNLSVIEESEIPETEEQDTSRVEELEQPVDELTDAEPELTDGEIETKTEPLIEEPLETEKQEKKDKQTSEHWGLKSKGRYMEAKGMKIKRAEEGSPKKDVFPFNLPKKPKDLDKPREKPYKDTKYQKQYNEKKYDNPKKQELERSFKKEKEESNKYFKQDKGRKENKEHKPYKQYHHEKDYKKTYDSRHHG